MGTGLRSGTVKHSLGNSVKINSVVKLRIGDKEIEIHDDPPTDAFFNDLYAELYASEPSPVLQSIGMMRIIDVTGESACDISGSSLMLSATFDQVTASGTCTYNSYEAPSTIRLYASDTNVPYFEIAFPSGISVQTGLPVSVTWYGSIYISPGPTSGYLAGADLFPFYINRDIASVLAGRRGSIILTLQYVEMIGISGTQTNVSILPKTQLTRDPTTRRAYLQPTKVITSGEIQFIYVYAYYGSQYVPYFRWNPNPFLTVSANDYVSLDISSFTSVTY